MSLDLLNTMFTAQQSSGKTFLENTGTVNLVGGFEQSVSVPIPHGYGSDELIPQVTIEEIDGLLNNYAVSPFATSGPNGILVIATVNSTNLIITIGTKGSSVWPATIWRYSYKLIIP